MNGSAHTVWEVWPRCAGDVVTTEVTTDKHLRWDSGITVSCSMDYIEPSSEINREQYIDIMLEISNHNMWSNLLIMFETKQIS